LALNEIAASSMRLRVPLLLIMALASGAAVWAAPHFNEVRWVAHTGRQALENQHLSLAEAVDRWEHINTCAGAVESCPKPIIIAGSGGARRAAFYDSNRCWHDA
jgi:hypothetical protein